MAAWIVVKNLWFGGVKNMTRLLEVFAEIAVKNLIVK